MSQYVKATEFCSSTFIIQPAYLHIFEGPGKRMKKNSINFVEVLAACEVEVERLSEAS